MTGNSWLFTRFTVDLPARTLTACHVLQPAARASANAAEQQELYRCKLSVARSSLYQRRIQLLSHSVSVLSDTLQGKNSFRDFVLRKRPIASAATTA